MSLVLNKSVESFEFAKISISKSQKSCFPVPLILRDSLCLDFFIVEAHHLLKLSKSLPSEWKQWLYNQI